MYIYISEHNDEHFVEYNGVCVCVSVCLCVHHIHIHTYTLHCILPASKAHIFVMQHSLRSLDTLFHYKHCFVRV